MKDERRMRQLARLWGTMGLLLASCEREPGITELPATARHPVAQIVDGARGGNAHFYFLPPMVSLASFAGTFDATQSPVVRICELASAGACEFPFVAEYTMSGSPASQAVRVDIASQHYIVDWNTAQFALDVSKTYRIVVLVHDLELGHADIDVAATGQDLRAVDQTVFVGVVNGQTLAIKFRIEEGAVTCAPLVTLDANNFVVSQNAGRLPPLANSGRGFFQGSQVLFAAGVAYGTSGDDLILGLDTRGVIEDLDLTSPVCLVERGNDQETYAVVRPLSGVAAPPGLVVTQRSFAFGTPPNNDFVILAYTVTNQGTGPVPDVFLGYVLDWDVHFSPTFTDEIAQFNPDLQIGEVVEANGALYPQIVGIVPLSPDPVHYAGFVNPCRRCSPPFDPTDHAGWFDLLSGGVQGIRIGPGVDIRHLVGLGPATLAPGASRVYAFALVGGTDRGDFETNVETARSMAQALGFGGAPVGLRPFGGSVSNTSLHFGETLVVEPAGSLPWDGDEFVTFGTVPSSFVLESSVDAIAVVVPRLPLGSRKLYVFQQGPEQRLEALGVTVASTFTPIGLDQLTTAPDISGGPFPISFFIELSSEDPDHFVTVAPVGSLPLTVRVEWQTSDDLDIYWMNEDGSSFVGNFDGATLANPEQSSVTVPAGETWRLRFNRFESSPAASSAPPTLARVTVTSP